MNKIKYYLGLALAAGAPLAMATTYDTCGSISSLVNSCLIETTEVGSIGKNIVTLYAPQGVNINDDASAIAAMDKLVVYVNGFDTAPNENSILATRYQAKLNDFLDKGYAVIAVRTPTFTTENSIQDSAFALQTTIEYINANRSQTATDMALLGWSVGGLTARYALANMEKFGIDHHVGLYVSNDAPHMGVHVPQSIQNAPSMITEYANQLQNTIDTFIGPANVKVYLEGVKYNIAEMGNEIRGEMEDLTGGTSNSMVAKQLIWDHIEGTTEKADFLTDLTGIGANNGYPKNTKNIAISNGSAQGTSQPALILDSSGAYYHFLGKKGANVADAHVGGEFILYPTVVGATSIAANFTTLYHEEVCGWLGCFTGTVTGGVPKNRTTPAGVMEYDDIPGSQMTVGLIPHPTIPSAMIDVTPGMMLKNKTEAVLVPFFNQIDKNHSPEENTFTFIPTFSALDIQVSDPHAAIDTTQSPFDEVYINGDNTLTMGVTGYENVGHLSIFWPQGVMDAIDAVVTAPPVPVSIWTNEEALLVWLNSSSLSKTDIEEVPAIQATTWLADEIDVYNTCGRGGCTQFTSLALAEMIKVTPESDRPWTEMTQGIIDAMVAHMEGRFLENETTYQECVDVRTPAEICAKML